MNIREVAARARVSTATISRTINQSSLVSPKTAERVWQAIRELGYYPNTQARALVSGKSRMFGLIISDITNPFFPDIVKSFEAAAIRQRYEVIVTNTDYQSDRMSSCVRRMIERKVDGVAIMTSEMEPRLVEELSRRQVAIVFLDVGKVKPLISNLSIDYSDGIRQAVQHLVSLGHRRISFISGPHTLKSARIRHSAFVKCLREYGLSTTEGTLVEGNHRIDGGETAMRKLLCAPPPPTAVLASNDLTAIGALRAITEAGLRVPGDISLVGFDDIDVAQITSPALTTVRVSRDEIGRKAFEALFQLVEDSTSRGQELELPTTLVLRASTAPARRDSTKGGAPVRR